MSQKYIKSKNNNSHNAKTYGKYYAKPVYDEKFVETDEIADFIQTQATLKRSDIKAAMRQLLEDLHRRYPRAVIVGHHDLTPHKDCPCFDAVNEYKDL